MLRREENKKRNRKNIEIELVNLTLQQHKNIKGSLSCVVVNALHCDIVISEFEIQSRYYVHFRTNTLERCMNLLIPLPPQLRVK